MVRSLHELGEAGIRDAVESSREELEDVYELIYTRAFPEFARETFEGFEPDARSYKQDEGLLARWLEAARRFMRSRPVEARIQKVQQTTIDWVNRVVQNGLSEGESIDQVATTIQQKWTDPESGINRWRAENISRTETISAANAGTREGAMSAVDELGIEMKRFWISTFDGRVREAHDTSLPQNAHLAEPRAMEEPYIVDGEALQFPGDPSGSPGNVIQCRCVEGYQVL